VLKQGSIISARVSDLQGGNPKTRPVVVVTPTSEISPQGLFVGVAITGTFSDPLADDEVALPFHPAGTASSGLRKPCVAKCSWMVPLRVTDVIDQKGFLTTERLAAILTRISSLELKAKDEQE